MTQTNMENMQAVDNRKLAAKINAYWLERNIIANARVELKKVPIFFKYINVERPNGPTIRKRIILDKPDMVRSYEIVSDLTFSITANQAIPKKRQV